MPNDAQDPGPDRTELPPPPPECGITVEPTDRGTRIVLPRRYSRVDLVIAGVSAAIAVWVYVWIRETATPEATGGLLAMWAVGALGVLFAFVAVSQAFAILAPRVIEDRGDRLVLARKIGVRQVLPHSIPTARIRAVERMWERGEDVEEAPGTVWVRTDDEVYKLGKGLKGVAVSWLEDAVRQMAGR